MIIVTPIAEIKDLDIIPTSEFIIDKAYLRDDQSNITIELVIVGVIAGEYYTTISIDFVDDLIENHIYDLNIVDDLDRSIYKDRLIATTQNPLTFSLNQNPPKYKSHNTTNEFITYGE
jgi:hypothetical protein